MNRDWFPLIGSLLVIGALYNHYLGHSVLLFEIVLVAIGSLMVIISMKVLRKRREDEEKGILVVFLSRFITEEQCSVLIPLFGFLFLLSWSIWKIFFVGEANLRMEDFIVTLFGLSLVLYYSGRSRFQKEKDFIVLYLMFLAIVFVVIWKTYSLITGESYARITMYAEYYFITLPVVTVLQLLGMDVIAVLNLSGIGISNIIEYYYEGHLVRLGIGTSCSGLYAAGLFFSAFLAFVLVRYRRIDRYIIAALAMGFAVTWLSNIVRMIVTIIVGMKYGAPALAFFHMYLGILLFIASITIFWFLIVRWLDRIEKETAPPLQDESEEIPQTLSNLNTD